MMRLLILFAFAMLIATNPNLLQAQTIERSVISSFGMTVQNEDFQLDCSVGQVGNITLMDSEVFFLQGFHQPRICYGDLNFDGLINTGDLLIFFVEYSCVGECGPADMNNDGSVTTGDLLTLLSLIGTECD